MAFTQLLTHLIWSTHQRNPWLRADIRPRLFAYTSGVCRNINTPLVIAGGVEDHVHLLIDLHPTVAVADAVRDIKANSSRFIHDTWSDLGAFKWQEGYSAFAVSYSARDDVYRYIENQPEHHRTRSFAEELREFYIKHGREWDPDTALK